MRTAARARRLAAVTTVLLLFLAAAPAVLAHETREVAGYQFVVGFIQEPVFTGQKSGLEFEVTKGEQPVADLENTLQAEVTFQDQKRALPLSPRFGQEGWYQSFFFPTAAGPYTFRIYGTIEGTQIDESFTSSPEGFNEVQEATAGQFPVGYPAQSEIVAMARSGRDASGMVPIALGAGIGGLVVGLLALAVALARRTRRT